MDYQRHKSERMSNVDKLERYCPFVWKKKLHQNDATKHLDVQQLLKLHKQKMRSKEREAEVLRKRREEREKIVEKQRETHTQIKNTKMWKFEDEYAEKWLEQEDSFFLQQAVIRSELRLKKGYGQTIDFLAYYVETVCKEELEGLNNDIKMLDLKTLKKQVHVRSPVQILDKLDIDQLEDLEVDIKVYMKVHSGVMTCLKMWEDILVVVQQRIRDVKGGLSDIRIPVSVQKDITKILKDKDLHELEQLEKAVVRKLKCKEGDISYWETMLVFIRYFKALLRLEQCYDSFTKNATSVKRSQTKTSHMPIKTLHTEKATSENVLQDEIVVRDTNGDCITSRLIIHLEDPTKIQELNSEHVITDPEQDLAQLQQKRNRIIEERKQKHEVSTSKKTNGDTGKISITQSSTSHVFMISGCDADERSQEKTHEAMCSCEKEKENTLGTFTDPELNENQHNDCVALCEHCEPDRKLVHDFHDEVTLKHSALLKKPRFYNKVHSGYIWNRYNRTHYDLDNPPPKTVLGYRFNIFYPDLFDKSRMPEILISPLEDEPGLLLLRINGGPPYEDIAFKVVDKEWDKSPKSGYRCQMVPGGCFQLWFRFKRLSYRR